MTERIHPWCYVPMFIGDKNRIRSLMRGDIELKPLISIERHDLLKKQIPDWYMENHGPEEQILKGCMINPLEFRTLGISMYPLELNDESVKDEPNNGDRINTAKVSATADYIPLNEQYKELGDTALIVLYPYVLVQGMNAVFMRQHPHQYEAVARTPVYVDSLPNDNYNASLVQKTEGWKKEILLLAQIRQDIAGGDLEYLSPMTVSIGSLAEIAVEVSVEDLIKGRYPKQIIDAEYLEYVKSFWPEGRSVHGFHKSFMAEIMPIEPTDKWITELRKVFSEDEWSTIAYSEKLRPDGASMARLAFRKNNSMDSVRFGINRISMDFYDYSDYEKQIVEKLVDYAYKVSGKRHCGMSASLEANLGRRDIVYGDYLSLDESFSVEDESLIWTHKLITDSRFGASIFGISGHQSCWHYTVSVSTPETETFRWYSPESVKSFFEYTGKKCLDYARGLLDSENPYENYQNLKRSKGKLD